MPIEELDKTCISFIGSVFFRGIVQIFHDRWIPVEFPQYFLQKGLNAESKSKMFDAVESLMLDLLEWLANGDRSYEEVMDAWRTSCPRFPVWEEANARRLVAREQVNGSTLVRVTSSGRAFLQRR